MVIINNLFGDVHIPSIIFTLFMVSNSCLNMPITWEHFLLQIWWSILVEETISTGCNVINDFENSKFDNKFH